MGLASLSSWVNYFAGGNRVIGLNVPPGAGSSIYDVTRILVEIALGIALASIGWKRLTPAGKN